MAQVQWALRVVHAFAEEWVILQFGLRFYLKQQGKCFTFLSFYPGVCLKLLCCWLSWWRLVVTYQIMSAMVSSGLLSFFYLPWSPYKSQYCPYFLLPRLHLHVVFTLFSFFNKSRTFTEFTEFLLQIMWILFLSNLEIPFSCASAFFHHGVCNLCFLNSNGSYGYLMTWDINLLKWSTLICYLNIHYFIL